MRKFTLFLTLFFATAMTMFAQDGVIDLTFNKVSATEATVNVASETLDVTSITADIKANYDWKSLTANNGTFPNASILCPDKNTNSMSAGNEGIITLTLNNVPAGYTFNKITFTSAAINGAGEFQGDDVNAQHVNFTLKQGDKTLGTAENVAIKVDSNKGQSVVIPFEMTEKCTPVDGKLELQLILSVTESKGCFYGLVKVSLDTTVEKEAAPLTVVSVNPTDAVEELDVITIEYSDEIAGQFDVMGMTQIYLGTKSNGAAYEVNGKVLTIDLFNSITTPGEYALHIPAGLITRVADGSDVTCNGEIMFYVVEPTPEPTYEYNDGYSNHSGRAFKSFTVTDGTNSVAVTDIQNVGKTPIYHDKTACVLETTAGAKISFSEFTWEGWWMHAYGYIDYNKDYVFGQDANATGTTGGELVTYNCYSTDNGSTYQDIYGNTASPETANLDTYYDMDDFSESKGLPHFYLPADLAAGDYRMRIKIDWNNIDPVKGSAKDIYGGGAQVDFIIRVAEAAVEPLTVAAITPEAGNVESIKEVIVTFDSELASVDASKISVEKVITPIEAYAGKWELTSSLGANSYDAIVNVEVVEKDGVKMLKGSGVSGKAEYVDEFYMSYNEADGSITLEYQTLEQYNGMDVFLFMGYSTSSGLDYGKVVGKINNGNIVFTSEDGADSFIICYYYGGYYVLSYFCELTWTPATEAAAPAKAFNTNNSVEFVENFAPAKVAKAEETEAAIEVSASVNGKDLIITTNVAANGTYKLVVAEGAVVAANGATNENIEAEYNVYREPTTVVNVTPAKAVTELDVIEIEYNVEIAGEFDVMGMTQIYVGSKSNGAAYEVNGKVLTIDLFNSITTPGDYALHIPAGLITRVSDGSDVTCDGEIVFTVKEPGYEYVEGNSGNGSRRLDSFTITDGTNSLTVTDIQATTTSPIFVDKTDNVLETTAGAYISFTEFNWEGYWMHAYAYIDYNNDFTFDQVANADGTTGGELVTYNCYSTDGGSTYQDIYGNTANPENANKDIYYDEDFNESKGLPQFYLPADLAAGDYRMRIKIDWNNIDPLGDKDIRPNGGAQVDFIIRVAEVPSYEYNEGDRNHGERALTSFTITDGTNSLNVTDIHQTGKGAIFVDKTDNVFETTAGAAVRFSEFNYLGVWMHAYAYIDYNNDYTFGQDANATGTTGGELVTYNCYSTDGSNYYDIWGNTASASNANSDTYYDEDFNESKGLPHFFLPADLAVGDYRMRIKVDWNNLDPVQGSKDMVNGGCEVDFIVRVAEATGIENVEVENGAQVIYDLTGRKVENANVRGIYIINGKKVLVK